MDENTITNELQIPADTRIEESSEITSLKKETDWFVGIDDVNNVRCWYRKAALYTALRSNILAGNHDKNAPVAVHSKDKDGNWSQADSTLFQFAKGYFKLRILYQPVWAHALAGLKWGAIIGIGLKLLDTTITLGMVDPTLALLFLVAIGVCLIPRVGIVAVVVISIAMSKFTSMNLFMTLIAATIIGAVLGCLPGMAIGGATGFIRNGSIVRANDAAPEPGGLFIKTVLLPLMGGAGLIAFYLFIINPWIVSVLQ